MSHGKMTESVAKEMKAKMLKEKFNLGEVGVDVGKGKDCNILCCAWDRRLVLGNVVVEGKVSINYSEIPNLHQKVSLPREVKLPWDDVKPDMLEKLESLIGVQKDLTRLDTFTHMYKGTRNYALLSEKYSDEQIFDGLPYGSGFACVYSAYEIFLKCLEV